MSVSLLSRASPGVSEILCGTANDLPASVDRKKYILLFCSLLALPYTSNRVQATYKFPLCGESFEESALIHGLSSYGSALLNSSITETWGFHVIPSRDVLVTMPVCAFFG